MNRKKVLVCIDKIKNLNSGLGRVSIEFANELIKHKAFDYTFLVPDNFPEKDFHGQPIIKLNLMRKVFSGYMKGFDLVHLLYQSPNYSFRKAKLALMTVHDINFIHVKSHAKKVKYMTRMQKAINKVSSLGFISHFSQSDTNEHLIINRHIKQRVIYNGISDSNVVCEKPLWCPDDFLFSIGIFTLKKNFHTLIPFLRQLPQKYILVIAGDSGTSYGNQIKSDIEKFNLNDRVILPGMISEAEKNYLYKHCKAFVFPSIAEGFGLPVIEAMRWGKPVFCSDKTSLKEIGSSFAYFWKSFEPAEMVKVFTKGMADFSDENQQNEIEYASSFTWKKNVEDYEKFYTDILNEEV